jgi:hypothetical protein
MFSPIRTASLSRSMLFTALVSAPALVGCGGTSPHSLLVYLTTSAPAPDAEAAFGTEPASGYAAGFLLEGARDEPCEPVQLSATANGIPIDNEDLLIDGCGASGLVDLQERPAGDEVVFFLEVNGTPVRASAVFEPARLSLGAREVGNEAPLVLHYDGPVGPDAMLALEITTEGVTHHSTPLGETMAFQVDELRPGDSGVYAEAVMPVTLSDCVGVEACSALNFGSIDTEVVVMKK